MSLIFLTMYPPITASKTSSKTPDYNITFIPFTKETASVTGINPLIPFPFGQKSDDFKLNCVENELSQFEIISQKLPIDAEHVGRYEFSPILLEKFLGENIKQFEETISLYLKGQKVTDLIKKHLTIIPKLLFIKKKTMGISAIIGDIIGVELCFPELEKTNFAIKRIAIFFIEPINNNNPAKNRWIPGFSRLALYNNDSHVFVITNVINIKKLIDFSFNNLISQCKGISASLIIPLLKKIVSSFEDNKIGLIIEQSNSATKVINDYSKKYELNYLPLADQNYLFFKNLANLKVNTVSLKKAPINSNYCLYGSLMGYEEKDIVFKYQLDGYLRSINNINTDGTIRYPYNIPEWMITHKTNFENWIAKYWNSRWNLRVPDERLQYDKDKEDAQKQIKLLKSNFSNFNFLKIAYQNLTNKNPKESIKTKEFKSNNLKPIPTDTIAKPLPQKKESIDEDLYTIESFFKKYVEDFKSNKTPLKFELLKLKNAFIHNYVKKYITKPITLIIESEIELNNQNDSEFYEKIRQNLGYGKYKENTDLFIKKLVSRIAVNSSYTESEKKFLLETFNEKVIDKVNYQLIRHFKHLYANKGFSESAPKQIKHDLLLQLIKIIIKSGYEQVKKAIANRPVEIEVKKETISYQPQKASIQEIPSALTKATSLNTSVGNPEPIVAGAASEEEKIQKPTPSLHELKKIEGLSDKDLQIEPKENNKKPQKKSWENFFKSKVNSLTKYFVNTKQKTQESIPEVPQSSNYYDIDINDTNPQKKSWW